MPPAGAVTDVAVGYVRLVETYLVVENADAAVVIDVALADQQVAVAAHEADRVADLADQGAGDGQLHDAVGLDAVGFGVGADDLQGVNRRHALALPDVGFDRLGVGRAAVGALEAEGRAGAGHEQPGYAVARKRDETSLVEVHEDWSGDPIDSLGKPDRPARVDRTLDGLGVVGLSVADRSGVAEGLGGARGYSRQNDRRAGKRERDRMSHTLAPMEATSL